MWKGLFRLSGIVHRRPVTILMYIFSAALTSSGFQFVSSAKREEVGALSCLIRYHYAHIYLV